MTAISVRAVPRLDDRALRPILLGVLVAVAVALFLVFQNTSVLPHDEEAPVFTTINDVRDWVRDNRADNPALVVVGSIRGPIGALANGIIDTLHYVGWLGIIGIAGALGFLAGGWRIAILMVVGLLALGVLGIRRVPGATVEAAESLGATTWQVLRKVQLPLARRVIGLAITQTIMLALGMVVITALIDAPGLSIPITRALFSNNVGAAFDAGIAVVILAILLDRLTEHASIRLDPRAGKATLAVTEPLAERVR